MIGTVTLWRPRRSHVLAGLLGLLALGLGAGTAAASVEGEERRVAKAEEALERAKEKVAEAERAVEEEQRRLEEEAEKDPKAHGTQEELKRLKRALEEAEAAQTKAEDGLRKARERLTKAIEKYAQDYLKKNPLPGTDDGIDDYIRRVRGDRKLGDRVKDKIVEEAEKARRALEGTSGAAPALPGARVVITGSVVGGDEATLAVVGAQGQRLSGVVVEIDGEEHVTGADGRAAFAVAGALGVLRVVLPSLPDRPAIEVPVVGPPPESLTAAPPRIERVPRYPTAGGDLPIAGAGFDGEATGNTVRLGDRELDVLAASPTGVTAVLPPELVGDVGALVVSTRNGSSEPVELTVVRFSLAGDQAHLTRGQTAVRRITVEGTSEPVPLRITNLAPGVVAMEGGTAITVTTVGGEPNAAEVRFTGVARGDFSLEAEVVETDPEPLSAEDWEAQARAAAEEAAGDDPPDAQGDKTREGSAWSSAGHVRSGRGEYEKAAEDFEKAAEAFEQAGREAQAVIERTNAGSAWSHAGDAARDAGDQERANECYEKAAQQFEQAGRPAQAALERAKIVPPPEGG